MAKILKNTTGSVVTITDVGSTVPANGQITIDPSAYNVYAASSSVVTLIGNGTLVVNDGSADLAIAAGVNFIEGLFPVDPSTATKQTPANASLASIDAKTPALGSSQAVTGTFWQATQPVSGTVAVTGTFWQATQPVSGTVAVTGTFWQATQPVSGTVTANAGTGTLAVSAASLPLPSGASTSAKQPALGTAGTASADVLSVQGVASMTALKTDGSAVTQPVSGTFWQATQPVSGTVAVTGTFWQATQPVSGTFWQATQPVSGTVAVTGTFWQATQPVSAASLPLPSGASTAAKQPALGTAGTASADVISVQGVASMTALKTDGSGVTQPVSGTFWPATQPVSGTVAVTGTFWQTTQPVSGTFWQATQPVSGTVAVTGTFWQATQPVSGTVTANAGTNLNTSALALDASVTALTVAQNSTTSGQAGHLAQGAVTTAAPAYTTAKTSPLSLTTVGALRTDSSSVTQPVSGTFWQATQPVSGTFWQATQPVSAASLPLPSGASTSAKQPALGTAGTASADVISVQGVASMTALKVDGSAATQPVSGTFWQTTQPVSKTDGTKATYSGGVAGLAVVTGGTDIFTITGSATKTVRITKLEISGTAATAVSVNFSLIKRSAADSGGTSASQTAVPLDSNNAAATATLLSYTASPTSLGAAVGTVRTLKVVLPVSGTFASTVCETFGDISQAVVLRGTAQQLAVNMNAAAVTTGNVDVWCEWTEEP